MKPWTYQRFLRYYRLVEQQCEGDQRKAAEMAEAHRHNRYMKRLAMFKSGRDPFDARTYEGYCLEGITLALFDTYAKYGNWPKAGWRAFTLHLYWVGKRADSLMTLRAARKAVAA